MTSETFLWNANTSQIKVNKDDVLSIYAYNFLNENIPIIENS